MVRWWGECTCDYAPHIIICASVGVCVIVFNTSLSAHGCNYALHITVCASVCMHVGVKAYF